MSLDYYSMSWRLLKARKDLQALIQTGSALSSVIGQPSPPPMRPSADGEGKVLLITPNEINWLHGSGVLLNRLYDPAQVIGIRSREDYADKGPFSGCLIHGVGRTRAEIFSMTMQCLTDHHIKSILCVPYYREDYLIGIAAKSILGVPMAVWVMDDSIIYQKETPARVAHELFDLADVRFAISPAMRDAYERDFQEKFYMLPPTVNTKSLASVPKADFALNLEKKVCAMVGNIWGTSWFNSLVSMIKKSGWTVHWFGKGSSCGWLNTTPEALKEMNIIEKGFIPENDLPEMLKFYPYAIIPTGTGDDHDDRRGVTMLSLPTRMPFLLAVAQMPMLVIGSAESSPAAFVRRFGVGLNCGYDTNEFASALDLMADSAFNSECRDNCANNAVNFSDEGLSGWIESASINGMVPDTRFEKHFRRSPSELVTYVEGPAPKELYGDFKIVYTTMRRIANRGYRPDFVVDVGGSSGVWSDAVHRVFSSARFVLIEPLPDRYPDWYHKAHPEFEWVAAAASNKDGKATFQVSNDLYGSSLFLPEDNRHYQSVEVSVTTLDSVLDQKNLAGRGIVKIDVQFAEHLVIEGATRLLQQVDFLVLELTLQRCVPEARTFLEMVLQMEQAGFRYFDDIGGWRNPVTGSLEQKDVVFVNKTIAETLGL